MTTQRFEQGRQLLNELHAGAYADIEARLATLAPEVARYIAEFGYGEIYSRPGLDMKTRELATIASLTTQGAQPQLKAHIHGALNSGASQQEIIEVMVQMVLYAGFPAVLNALESARSLFESEKD